MAEYTLNMTGEQIDAALVKANQSLSQSDLTSDWQTPADTAVLSGEGVKAMVAAVVQLVNSTVSNAVAGKTSSSDVQNLINVALQRYTDTLGMNMAISSAVSDKVTLSEVNSAISTALNDYVTTSDMHTAIYEATLDYVSTAVLNNTLNNYVTSDNFYSTLSGYSTTDGMNIAIQTALSNYSTTSEMNTAIANACAAKLTFVILAAGEDLPSGSELTLNKIYLKPNSGSGTNVYDEWMCWKKEIESGSGTYTYEWEKIGTTEYTPVLATTLEIQTALGLV